jgi:hypothetical protein
MAVRPNSKIDNRLTPVTEDRISGTRVTLRHERYPLHSKFSAIDIELGVFHPWFKVI